MAQKEKLDHAKRALDFADEAYRDLIAPDIAAATMDRRWREFLTNWNSCFNLLKKAAQPGSTKKIADRAEFEQKTNAIVQYLFQARDADEHVGKVVDRKVGSLEIGGGMVVIEADGPTEISFVGNMSSDLKGTSVKLPDVIGTFKNGRFDGLAQDPSFIKVKEPFIELLPATSRGRTYEVPMQEIDTEKRALEIAAAGLKYLNALYLEISSAFEE